MIRWPRAILIFFLRLYRRFLSPLKPPMCRFHPTCSQYAIEALQEHGVFRGLRLAIWRLMRCQPFARGGYDPVPPRHSHVTNANETDARCGCEEEACRATAEDTGEFEAEVEFEADADSEGARRDSRDDETALARRAKVAESQGDARRTRE